MDELARTPGLNKSQLADRLGEYSNLIDFHLNRLVDHGIVVVRESPRGRERLCFLSEDEHLWEDEHTRILFGRVPARRIAMFLADNPGASTAEIAEHVDLSEVTVRHHLRTLREYDLVDQVRDGRSFEYHPSDDLSGWAAHLGDRYRFHADSAPDPERGSNGGVDR